MLDPRTDFKQCPYIHYGLGADFIAKIPILNIRNRESVTEYIDFITPQEMTAPIMKGIDKYCRPFLAIRYATDVNNQLDTENLGVDVFFQRFSDDPHRWCCSNRCNYNNRYLFASDQITEQNGPELQSILAKIAQGATLLLNDEYLLTVV